MAKIPRIQFKRTKNPGVKPSKDILAEGELAINLADRMLFTKSGEEIIDLGFAKGGTVNGDIIQETGNFTTNGNIRLKEYLNINGPDNKALNIAYDSRGPLIGVNEGDNKWKVLQIPAETGTFASREWVNTFVKTGTIQTDLKAPDNTTVLTINNSKLLSFKDGTTDIFAVDIKGGYMRNSLILSGQNDYPGITLQKNDTFKVRIETDTDSSNTLLAFAYRDSGNSNKFVIKMPKENGVLATQSWVDNKYYHKDSSYVSFRDAITLSRSAGKEKLIIEYNGANGQWRFAQSADGSTNWMRHVLPTESGTIATRGWVNNFLNRTGADTYIQSADGKHWLTIVNDGMFSVWHNDTKQRSFYVETGGAAVAAHSVRAPSIIATRGASELIKLGFNSTGSPFLSYFDTAGKWTAYYFPNSNGGTVASQEWSNSNHYKKAETYNKSEIDGKVNGRLTQSQADGRYVRMDLTNLGKQYTPAETIASGKWGRPIGFSTMTHPNTPNKPAGITGYGYWHVIAGRDQGNGYAGFFTEHGGGRVFYGRGETGGANPTWSKVYTEASKPTPGEIGAYTKGETYSRAEVDSRVNGRLTQAQADGRYPLKGNVYTKTESDGRYMRKGEAPSEIKFTGIRNINPVSESQHDSNPGYSISYFNKEELYGRLVRFTYWDQSVIGAGRQLGSSEWHPYFGDGSARYGKRGTHARAQVAY